MLEGLPRFRFRVPPWQHQGLALRRSWDQTAFALYMEQGTGKTKVIIDTAGLLYLRGQIAALLVVAPDGVQRAWVRDELPKHMSPAVAYQAAVWVNQPTRKQQRQIDALYDNRFSGLRVLAVNYETLATRTGAAGALKFLRTFEALMVADESHRIKNVKTERAAIMHKLGPRAKYRRILTGTPVATSPLDVYSQFLFLDESILGYQSWVAFRAHYAVLEESDSHLMRHIVQRLEAKFGKARAAKMAPQLIARDPATGRPLYRNMDELIERLKPHSFRVLKSECLDLPPKVYQRRYVSLSPEQRRIYNQLRDEFIAEYAGMLMATPLVITRLTRLQQITGGFFKPHADAETIPIAGKNPKVKSLLDACAQASGKVLIWARFKAELELIAAKLEEEEEYGAGSVARYWSGHARDSAKAKFMNEPRCRFFVAQPKAGGTGLDGLQIADTVIYYSNEFALIDRLQSEDRAHRGGSERHASVTIIDIEAEDTLDTKIIDALRSKKDLADAITGDPPRNWL